MYRRNLPLGITLVLLSASAMVGAYHIDYDQWTPGTGNPADEWFTPAANPGLIICESTGSDIAGMGAGADKVNPNPIPNSGEGGLCYASSQDFADCDFTFFENPVTGEFIVTDGTCTYEKVDEKEKKPDPQDTWGMIEPKCMPTPCPANKNETGVGQDWFARVASNTRSCNGAWGQTFVYKEAIAYWGGAAPNPATGASGHVEFFVNTADATGTYDRAKIFTGNPMTVADQDKTADNCTGNGSSWGLVDSGVGKP